MAEDYYYHWDRRVPVHRREGFIAVRFRAKVQEQGIQGFIKEYQKVLKPHVGLQEIQRTHFRIYEILEEHTDSGSLLQKIRQHADIHEAGEIYEEKNRILVQTDELVVKFKPELRSAQIDEIKKEYGLETVKTFGFSGGAFVLRVTNPQKSALEIANRLVEKQRAIYAYPNWIENIGKRHAYSPNDPWIINGQQWYHSTIETLSAWDKTKGEGIILAVVDYGFDVEHEDLKDPPNTAATKIVGSIDLTANPPNPDVFDEDSHGTEVAGMAIAAIDNGTTGAGSAPKSQLMPIKVNDKQEQLADAFQYAADQGADVITCSLGPSDTWTMTPLFKEAIDYATTYGRQGRGCVYTQAVFNGSYPISLDQVSSYERSIAVNATNSRDEFYGSGYGPELDLTAPGHNINTITNCNRNNQHQVTDARTFINRHGTSYAAPLTAGVACLVLSKNNTLSWEEVRQVLLDSADKIIDGTNNQFPYQCAPVGRPPGNRSDYHGYGRLNAKSAVNFAIYGSPRDLYIRDTRDDTGAELQPAWGFWDSPDIWVRNQDDNIEEHQEPIPGQDNFIFARVSNRGPCTSLPAWVRFYMTTYAGTEFRYPYDYRPDTTFDPGGLPGNRKDCSSDFPAPATYLIGEVKINSVDRGLPRIVSVKWEQRFLPSQLDWDPCLLVEVSPHDGPLPAGLYEWGRPFVWGNNNLAKKSLAIITTQPGQDVNFPFRFGHPQNTDYLNLEIADFGSAPKNYPLIQLQSTGLTSVELVDPNGRNFFDLRPNLGLRTGQIQAGGWKKASLNLKIPPGTTGQSYDIDIAQKNGKGQLIGGLRLRVNII
ncbi:MAG: S8 family serine peptidase [Deltaproteobacteria bacterium]|nr:S8 family serine peptidase [Deltaproteobacteria bacterium]